MNAIFTIRKFSFLFSLLTFIAIGQLQAATVTWVGGVSDWNITGNWDTGTIPTGGDDVIIPAGSRVYVPNGYTAVANSVDLNAGADMYVRSSAALLINNSTAGDALLIAGRMSLQGNFEAIDPINTAIRIAGKLYTTSNSQMLIDEAQGYAIHVESSGIFYNRGYAEFYDSGSANILNHGRCYNKGTLELEALSNSGATSIANFDRFYNYSAGTIDSYGGGTYNIVNNSGGLMINYGDLNISASDNTGLGNYGIFQNKSSGYLQTLNCGFKGIYNFSGAIFTNDGYTFSNQNTYEAMLNGGTVTSNGLMNLIGGNYAYRSFNGSVFNNNDLLYLQSLGGNSMSLSGTFTNEDAGNIFMYEKCFFNSGSLFENHGFVTSDYTGTHWRSGAAQIVNHRLVNDIHGSFWVYIDNQQVVTQPLSGTLQNGVPFADPMDVTSLSNVTIGTWHTAPGSPVAGTYDEVNNEFTPNATAIGATELRVNITNNTTGNSLLTTIKLDTPISAMVSLPQTQLQEQQDRKAVLANQINIYPNPNSGVFKIDSDILNQSGATIKVKSIFGRIVYQQQVEQFDFPQVILSENLPNGNYTVHIQSSLGIEIAKQIQLFR